MKINFILPFIEKTGGVLVVFEYALRLQKMGHTVRVYYPLFSYDDLFLDWPVWKRPFARIRHAWGARRRRRRAAFWFAEPPELVMVPMISGTFVPPADFVIATTWPTAYSVARLPPSRGEKLYFVQHYETWTGNIPAVDASFSLGLRLVTIAPWLTALMREKFGRDVAAELHNGIDLEKFRPAPRRPEDRPVTVLMMFHTAAYKGVDDGLAVLRRLSDTIPQVRIRLFGQYPLSEEAGRYPYALNPTPAELVALYQSSDVFLSPSITEGWHLPPMEALACGCAVVATRVGCIPVLDEGDNMLTADPGDRDALFRHLERLVTDETLRKAVSARGLETMSRYSWERKAGEFEKLLYSFRAQPVKVDAKVKN